MTQITADVLAVPEAISGLTEQLMDFLAAHDVDARATHHVALIVEEFLTNLGTHGNCRAAPARVMIAVEAGQVRGEIIDAGAPFDPRSAPAPDLDLAGVDRPEGGLGLYLVRQLSCDLGYVRQDGQNKTTFAVPRAPVAIQEAD